MIIERLKKSDVAMVLSLAHNTIKTVNSRDYSPAEIKLLLDLYNKEGFLNVESFVLKINNEIVGLISFEFRDDYAKINDLFVKEPRKGYGRVLYEFVEDKIKKSNFKRIFLRASLTAVKFYERMGFKRISDVKKTSYGVRIIEMEKFL